MGTTSRNLRYPEGTTPGNQLHTRIKELADDTTTQLNALKIEVVGRTFVQQAHVGATFPNNGVDTEVARATIAIPSTSETIDFFASNNGSAGANAAGYWYLQVQHANGTFVNFDSQRVHNNAVVDTGLGCHMYASLTVSELGSPTSTIVRLLINVDPAGAPISVGPTHFSATHKRVN